MLTDQPDPLALVFSSNRLLGIAPSSFPQWEVRMKPGLVQYLVPPGDVDALAISLRRLFADPDPGSLGSVLAERAAQRYSAQACARAHEVLYQELLT
jgi:hypothetical protein